MHHQINIVVANTFSEVYTDNIAHRAMRTKWHREVYKSFVCNVKSD